MAQRIIITLFSLILLLFIWPVNEGFTGNIIVDASQNMGNFPDVMRPGMMGLWSQNFTPLKTEIDNLNSKPFWRLTFGFGTDVPGGNSSVKPLNFEADFKSWLKKSFDPHIRLYQDAGYKVIISLTQVPKWLSNHPSDELLPYADGAWFTKWAYSPPSDYNQWQNLISLFVQTLKEDGVKADFIVGDEPDWMFYGTEEQYLEMYAYTVEAIKEVDQANAVGALGVSSWSKTKFINCPADVTGLDDGSCPLMDHSMIAGLINYVATHQVPLDFIDWHFPDPTLVSYNVIATRQWLQNSGLPESMPLTIGEWLLSGSGEYESTEMASAYSIFMLKSLMDAGI